MNIDHSRDALLTDFGKATLKDRYLLEDEKHQDLFARVANHYSDNEDHAQRLYDYMSNHWFMPATPVLSNGGTKRGLPISCFLNSAEDSMESIVGLWNENVWLASKGGGIGSYLGGLRSIGERIGNNGKTSGIIPFVHVMDSMTLAISQGGIRRGSAAVYLQVNHPEIEEFIELRRPTGGDLNRKALNLHHGVVISDAFMQAVLEDKKWDLKSPKTGEIVRSHKARDLWIRILTARLETGEPYLLFEDTVNKAVPEHHKKSNLKVKTSNLCVAPETPILTDKGYFEISSLEDQTVSVWNGTSFSSVVVKKTGTGQKLITIKFSDGSSIDCTPYHKFYIQENYNLSSQKEVRAIDLNTGDKIAKFSIPVIHSGDDLENSYVNGFFSADGTYSRQGVPLIWLYGIKRELSDQLIIEGDKYKKNDGGEHRDSIFYTKGSLWNKFIVPTHSSIKTRLDWFAGFCDGYGVIVKNGSNQSLQVSSNNLPFLEEIRLMLHTLGVQPKIALMHDAKLTMLPDGLGGKKEYNCKAVYRLLVTSVDLQDLFNLGLTFKRLKIENHNPQRDARSFIKVVSVSDNDRIDDTYCVNEPVEHKVIFNGILTGNCVEIVLPTGIDHLGNDRTAVCCLSSVNLEYWDQWNKNEQFIEDIMRFLDNVLQDFIDNAPDTMAKARYSAMRERSVGLGVMGFHSFLQSKGIPWESVMAQVWNKKFFKHIRAEANLASLKLSRERGACPDAAEHGIEERFSYKMAVAPTASISVIAGNSSPGIDPITANVYLQKTLSGNFSVRNRHLQKVLAAHGKDDDETWSTITVNKGSVQHLKFLTKDEKDVFKTAFEIDQNWVVEHAADRAPYICQSQSVNLFLPGNVHKRELHRIHVRAWKRGVKSLYYCRSLAVSRTAKVSEKVAVKEILGEEKELDQCLSCQ